MIEIEQFVEREVIEMPRIEPEIQRARAAVYRPLVDVIEARGIRQTWLAERLGLRRQRLWNYLNGVDRVPPDFIVRACRELSLPPSLIVIPEPRDRYIQTPKPTKTPKQQPKGGRKNGQPKDTDSAPAARQSVQRVNRVRRAGRSAPTAPRASHQLP